jgi:hypothetical protein
MMFEKKEGTFSKGERFPLFRIEKGLFAIVVIKSGVFRGIAFQAG